jgi:hypothetical protein
MPANLRFDARRDANEAEIVSCWRSIGGAWYYGAPLDGWAGIAGRWIPVEIKRPERKGGAREYTVSQQAFRLARSIDGLPWETWRTVDDCIATANRIRVGER